MGLNENSLNDDIVISGVACRLPESRNVEEFWENLINGRDMVTEDDRRWPPGLYGLPRRNGKIPDLSSFDADYFGISSKQVDRMDPQLRLLLEVAYEAIFDSGCSFNDLSSGSTGVFIGTSSRDGHELLTDDDPDNISGYEMTGGNRAMLSNRLSYCFDLKGPSVTLDTACSSGLYCLESAVNAIREGRCERALVGASNLILKPEYSLQNVKLRMLSPDGACKAFDSSANGYVRSEGIVVMLVEKATVSLKSYLTVVDILASHDGYKKQGVTYPSPEAQHNLLTKVYSRAKTDPKSVSYVEAHSTGTPVGDPIELNTIADVMTEGRKEPLLVGAVKSNMGHTEAVAGLVALLKVILAHRHGVLPRNLHFNEANPNIPGLKDGRLQVVSTNTPWEGGIVGINAFGFGGAIAHVIVKTPPSHQNSSISSETVMCPIPQMLFCSGNAEKTVEKCLAGLKDDIDTELVRIFLERQSGDSLNYQPARGFSIPELDMLETCLNEKSQDRPLWFIYSGMGTQWPGMGREFMHLAPFKDTIIRCHNSLKQEGFDLMTLMQQDDDSQYDDPQNAFVAICAIQLALTRVLLWLGLKPDGLLGHSVGELGCAFADGTLTVEQTIAAAYWRGQSIKDAQLPKGAMAAIGLTWEECQQRCPEGVVPACHNAPGTVTISGPSDKVHDFVQTLKDEGIFAKEVNSSGVAFHSYAMEACAPSLKASLKKIIPKPVRRSERWISSSIPQAEWNTSKAQYSSQEYHVNNFVSPVLFKEAMEHVPDDAIVIEIGPHALLQAVLKRGLSKNVIRLSTMMKHKSTNMRHFLINLGRCYINGKAPNISKLYSPNNGTTLTNPKQPMLSDCVQWDHSVKWHVPKYATPKSGSSNETGYQVDIDISREKEAFLKDHVIDGRILYPAAGYLVLAWEALAKRCNVEREELDVVIKEVKIHESTVLHLEEKVTFNVHIVQSSGRFEITEGDNLKCSGIVKTENTKKTVTSKIIFKEKRQSLQLDKKGLYQELRLRGYDYGPEFQRVQFYKITEKRAVVSHGDNWITFLDALMHVLIVEEHSERALRVPTRIQEICITPSRLETNRQGDVTFMYLEYETAVHA